MDTSHEVAAFGLGELRPGEIIKAAPRRRCPMITSRPSEKACTEPRTTWSEDNQNLRAHACDGPKADRRDHGSFARRAGNPVAAAARSRPPAVARHCVHRRRPGPGPAATAGTGRRHATLPPPASRPALPPASVCASHTEHRTHGTRLRRQVVPYQWAGTARPFPAMDENAASRQTMASPVGW